MQSSISPLSTEQIKPADEATTVVTLSPEMQADEKSISASHKEVLKTLSENSFSAPIAQVSRVDNSIVYRIFYLKKHSKKVVPPFEKVADDQRSTSSRSRLIKKILNIITKLRERLGYDEKHMVETLPKDFQPFAIR